MDYGDGTLNGEYQFNSQYNKAEVCAEITSSMNNPQVQNCWSDFKSTCGNGIIEPGESCDDSSSCCVSCLLASNAECSGGPCCDNCKFALTTKNCGTQGYCASGVCTQSTCVQYPDLNLNFCSVSPNNPCQQTCSMSPSTSCNLLSNFNISDVPLNGSIVDGTPCGSSPSKICSAGQCVSTCPKGYFPIILPNFEEQCEACDQQCSSCNENGFIYLFIYLFIPFILLLNLIFNLI